MMRQNGASWTLGVLLRLPGMGPTAMVAAQLDPAVYEHAVRRVRSAGWERLSPAGWAAARWPITRGAADVWAGGLVRFTTGEGTSFYSVRDGRAMPVTAAWLAAVEALGRALVVVAPSGTWEAEAGVDDPAAAVEAFAAAAAARVLWAGMCAVRVDMFPPRMWAAPAR